MATPAGMFFVKFIREDLDFLPTTRTFADERFQTLKLLKTRTVSWNTHFNLLLLTMNNEQRTIDYDLCMVNHRDFLLVTVLARLEVVPVVAGRIAPLDIGLGEGGKIACRRLGWMRLMTVAALWNSLGLFRAMRHVSVRGDLLAAWRHIARGCSSELVERSMATQASLLGGCRRLTIGSGHIGRYNGRHQQEHPDA